MVYDSGSESNDDEYTTSMKEAGEGRWTREEHQSFLKAIQLYGREWKLVQTAVKTRTSSQIRSHAQKYYQKCAKAEPTRFLSGACEDAFLILEMCERVLNTLKQKRDDILLRDSGSSRASSCGDDVMVHHETISSSMVVIDNIELQLNQTMTLASLAARNSMAGDGTFARDPSTLEDDELIALEVLCAGSKRSTSPEPSEVVLEAQLYGSGLVTMTLSSGTTVPMTLACDRLMLDDHHSAHHATSRNRAETITTTTSENMETASTANGWEGLEDNPMAVKMTNAFEYGFLNCRQAPPNTTNQEEGNDSTLSRKRPVPVPMDPTLYETNMQQYRKRLKPL